MITERDRAYTFSGLSERNLRALMWLVEQGTPQRWYDITDASAGYRPSWRTVIDPLLLRKLIAPSDGGEANGIKLYVATPAGASYAVRAARMGLT